MRTVLRGLSKSQLIEGAKTLVVEKAEAEYRMHAVLRYHRRRVFLWAMLGFWVGAGINRWLCSRL